MSHELTIKEDGTAEMFSGRNMRPWHGLGRIVEGLLTSQEAIMAAQLNWKVGLLPVVVGGKPVDEYKAVTREDNGKVLSIMKNRYTPIQNEDSFSFFDEIVGGGQAVFDTAGSLFEGRKVFISAKIPGNLFLDNDKNDTLEKYVLLFTSHDGTTGLTMQLVSVRSVCFNTVSLAMRGATNQIKIRHTKSYKDKVSEAQKTLGIIHGYYDDLSAVINSLSKQKMGETEAITMIERLFPSKEGEKVATRTLNARTEVLELFRRGAGNKGETKWDFVNGVTEYVTHSRGTRVAEGGNEQENRMASVLFGSGAALAQKAFDLVTV